MADDQHDADRHRGGHGDPANRLERRGHSDHLGDMVPRHAPHLGSQLVALRDRDGHGHDAGTTPALRPALQPRHRGVDDGPATRSAHRCGATRRGSSEPARDHQPRRPDAGLGHRRHGGPAAATSSGRAYPGVGCGCPALGRRTHHPAEQPARPRTVRGGQTRGAQDRRGCLHTYQRRPADGGTDLPAQEGAADRRRKSGAGRLDQHRRQPGPADPAQSGVECGQVHRRRRGDGGGTAGPVRAQALGGDPGHRHRTRDD